MCPLLVFFAAPTSRLGFFVAVWPQKAGIYYVTQPQKMEIVRPPATSLRSRTAYRYHHSRFLPPKPEISFVSSTSAGNFFRTASISGSSSPGLAVAPCRHSRSPCVKTSIRPTETRESFLVSYLTGSLWDRHLIMLAFTSRFR